MIRIEFGDGSGWLFRQDRQGNWLRQGYAPSGRIDQPESAVTQKDIDWYIELALNSSNLTITKRTVEIVYL